MKSFRRLYIITFCVLILLTALLNVFLLDRNFDDGYYRVEAKRLSDQISQTGSTDVSQYKYITGVYKIDDDHDYISDEHYLVINADGALYRVEYRFSEDKYTVIAANCVMAAVFMMLVCFFVYIKKHIIVPFGKLNSVPQELAKGNLSIEIPEEKSRFFGKFTWGVNLLRESIEDSRKKELTMQKDKKLLLLSLSHDIKTPLSAIKLNAKALAKGLYKDEAKQRETAESINSRADEIEHFVSEITKAASEDFMVFEVNIGEVFLSVIIDKVIARYSPQLSMAGTQLKLTDHNDCILSCDADRLGECLQNLIENAIKYGDGREIELMFDKMDGCELITVSNTGCTLEKKELPQIFESFHRGENVGSKSGNGLGLFICKRLMTLMGGEVYADISDDRFNATLVVRLA